MSFLNLKDFLEERTAITTDPLLQTILERAKTLGYKRGADSRSKASANRAFNVVGSEEEDEEERCFLCDSPLHSVFKCKVFLNYDEKTRFQKLYKVRCLNCGEKHASKDCKDERQCKDKACPILTNHSPKLHGGFRKWNEAKQNNAAVDRSNDERSFNDGGGSRGARGRGGGRGRGGYNRDEPAFTRSVGRGGIGSYNGFGRGTIELI